MNDTGHGSASLRVAGIRLQASNYDSIYGRSSVVSVSMKQKLARGLRGAQEVFPQPVQAEDADFHLIR